MLNVMVFSNMRRFVALVPRINPILQTNYQQQLNSLLYCHILKNSNLAALTSSTSRLFNTGSRFFNASNRKSQFVRAQIIKALNCSRTKAVIRIDKKSITAKPTMTLNQAKNTCEIGARHAREGATTVTQSPAAETASIFKRFKEAYKQHGKILICTHAVTSIGWYSGFFMLSKGGFDITVLFNVLEKCHLMSKETTASIVTKIDTFKLEEFLQHSYFNYILTENAIKWLGESITGNTLKYTITSVMLYKLFTPLRYLVTIGGTNLIIKLFKRRGVIPPQPPAGSSIRELYSEQKHVIRRSLKTQREKYRKRFVKR